MNKGLKAGLTIGAVVAAIWLVSVIGFTVARNDCLRPLTGRCNDGLIEAYGDFVQLGWVEKYQTLLSGALALLAGSFVYAAARYQARDVARRDVTIRRSGTLDRLAMIRNELLALRQWLGTTAITYSPVNSKPTTAAVRQNIGMLGAENHVLVEYLLGTCNSIDRGIEQAGKRSFDFRKRGEKTPLANATAMCLYLRQPDDLLDAKGAFVKVKKSGDVLTAALDNWDCEWLDLTIMMDLFTSPTGVLKEKG